MSVTVDYTPVSYNMNNDPVMLVRTLLDSIRQNGTVDYACMMSRAEDLKHVEQVASSGSIPAGKDNAIVDLLTRRLGTFSPADGAEIMTESALDGTGFRSAVVFPLSVPDEVLGVVGVFSKATKAFSNDKIAPLAPLIGLARTVVENVYMYNVMAQNLIVTQSIQLAAREIAANPSPQHVVNILRDYFFDAHVTSCALLLFGPMREDRPAGPFEYVEIKGTWSKRRGSGVGVGLRFYLQELPDVIEQLDEHGTLIFQRAKDLSVRLDPLSRAFMQAERVRSVTLLHLRAGNRKLGVIFVGTDKRHEFTPQELHSYQTVSEFLAINVMTQMLQVEHDRVMQGRAALLESVTDGVLMVLPSASGARVLTHNKRFLELFDMPDSNLHDVSLTDVIDKLPFPESVREDLRKVWLAIPVRDPATQQGEFHVVNEEGHPVDIEWYSAPVYQENAVLGRIYTFHDVTAQRTAQRLRAAFLSRVSHELRTPLTSIRGFAEFILQRDKEGDQLPDLAREYTEIILSSAKHLNHIFTEMIEMTRAEAGELKLNRQEAHMPDLIIDVVARMELIYKARNQQVIMELDDDLPGVSLDVEKTIQVLQNLMTNAIKYAPADTTIYVSTDYVATPADLPEGSPQDVILPAVMVTVRDEGKGLTKEDADKVFMPFYRTEDAKKQKIEGVGLGLAVTRSIVEMQRGRIWAEPNRKDRQGGIFHFTLPTLERA